MKVQGRSPTRNECLLVVTVTDWGRTPIYIYVHDTYSTYIYLRYIYATYIYIYICIIHILHKYVNLYTFIYIYVYINSFFPTLHFSAFRPFNLSRTSLEARGFGASEEPAGVGLMITMLINHLIHERYPGWLGYRGDEILPNDIGIISYTIIGIPKKPTRIPWKVKRVSIFVAQNGMIQVGESACPKHKSLEELLNVGTR